jgi:dienelactone hydrolase
MKRAWLVNTNKYEDFSCEFHPTLEINYFRMKKVLLKTVAFWLFCFFANSAYGQINPPFSSKPLTEKGDLSALMVEGIDRFLTEETGRVSEARAALWHRDFSSPDAFRKSVAVQCDFLSQRLGVVDERLKPEMEVLTSRNLEQLKVETDACVIRAVRWSVTEGLKAEGLLLQPKGMTVARIIMIPDADILPEVLAGIGKQTGHGYGVAKRLAEAGCEVIIPVLVNRDDTFSGSTLLNRYTNQPHREWIYRQAYEVGRHIIGYELQKIFSAIDWMEQQNTIEGVSIPVGVAGYGEGGLLALYASALDRRISSTLVSGYFNAREQLWSEPMYRNVFGLLKFFGDAELAVMSWPECLVIEHSLSPEIMGPPKPDKGRAGAAPGRIGTPDFSTSDAEIKRAAAIVPAGRNHMQWLHGNNGEPLSPFSDQAIDAFITGLKVRLRSGVPASDDPVKVGDWLDVTQRQKRTVKDMEHVVQYVLALCERTRNTNFWQKLKGDTAAQRPVKAVLREQFRDVIGHLPVPSMPANAHARQLRKTEKWTSYELTLDVWPGVFAWGILIIPNNIRQGEKRPVVVCQHGLEGLPSDVVDTNPESVAYRYYKGFATKLAEKGYVTFSPHNPYRGEDKFRVLQRKANPLGLTLFSVITGQHQRIVEWLGRQSFVDPKRIAFYGLSYGGKTAMRVPALVEGYAMSICSGDFYEWVRYNASTSDNTYMYTKEYEIFEWDLGHTFNYAEMAGLIAPRPFMVERGYLDNPETDEWVSYEFEKVSRHYDFLNLPGFVRIEHFMGPHTINGVGTFEFLDKHLGMKTTGKIKQ